MNQRGLLLCLLLFAMTSLVSAREIGDGAFIDVASFANGSGENEILFDIQTTGDFPRGIGFAFYQQSVGWVISCPQNQRVLITNDSFKVLSTLPFSSEYLPPMIYFDPKGWAINSNFREGVQIWNLKEMKTDYISLEESGQMPFYPVYLHKYDLYITRSATQFQGILDMLELSKKKRRVIGESQILNGSDAEYLKSLGIRFSEESFSYRGFVVSPSFKTFLHITDWTAKKNKSDNIPFNPEGNINGYYSGAFDDFDVSFQGNDLDGNYYWTRDSVCYVFNKSGDLGAFLNAPNYDGSYKYKYILAVHPSGDIYRFLMTGNKMPIRVQLLRNTWDPDSRKLWDQTKQAPEFITTLSIGSYAYPFGLWKEAKISDSNVRVRQRPDLQGEILTQLDKSTPVTLLDVTPTKQKINNMETPWYLVRTWDGLQGWVYGGFVGIQK